VTLFQKRGETGENEGTPNTKDVKQKLPRVPVAGVPHDPVAIRTIVISGLPTSIDSKVLWKKIRKYRGAEKVEWPVQSELKEEVSSAGAAIYRSQKKIS
jgi:nucleolar protein 4